MPIVSTWVPDPPPELRYRLRVDAAKHPELALYLWSCMGSRANNDLLVTVLEAGYAALMSQASDAASHAGQTLMPHRPPPSASRERNKLQRTRAASPAPGASPSSRTHVSPAADALAPIPPDVTLVGSSSTAAPVQAPSTSVPAAAASPQPAVVSAEDPFSGSRPSAPEPTPFDDPEPDSAAESSGSSLLSKFISL